VSYYAAQPQKHPIEFRENDRIHLKFLHPKQSNQLEFQYSDNHQWLEEDRVSIALSEGDWTEYSFFSEQPGELELSVRASTSSAAAELRWQVDGHEAAPPFSLFGPEWSERTATSGSTLPAGHHTLRLHAAKGECLVDWIKLE